MISPILILISSNPLESHRAVEGLRIALGLLSGDHPIKIVLMDQAPLMLSDEKEDLEDGELLPKYLPSFDDLGQTFFIEEETLKKLKLDQVQYQIEPISRTQIAELLNEADRLIAFS